MLWGVSLATVGGAELDVPQHWRFFSREDGLRDDALASVEVGPRGRVWATYERDPGVDSLDGFSIQSYPAPTGESGPVFASRTGQIWALRNGVIWHFSNGVWSPVAQGLAALSGFPWRVETPGRPVALLPAEFNHALVATPEAVVDIDAVASEARLLWRAEDLGLGPIVGLRAAFDVGGWILCERGVVWIDAPLRRLDQNVERRPIAAPRGLDLRLASSATADEDGGLTLALSATAESSAEVVHFSQGQARAWKVDASSPIAAWRTPDSSFWLATTYTIQRFPENQGLDGDPETLLMPQGRIVDVAVGPEGLIAVATSQGLFRFATPLWRPSQRADLPWTGPDDGRLLVDAADEVWWLSGRGAYRWTGDRFRREGPWGPDLGKDGWVGWADRRVLGPGVGGLTMVSLEGFESIPVPVDDLRGGVKVLGAGVAGAVTFCGGRNSMDGALWVGRWTEAGGRWIAALPEGWATLDGLRFADWEGGQTLWLGGSAGLAQWSDGQWRVFGAAEAVSFGSVYSTARDAAGRRWFGGDFSVYYWDGRQFQIDLEDVGPTRRLATTRDGAVWAVCAGGLFERRNGLWTAHGPQDGLPREMVFDVFEGPGRQWMAMTPQGVYRLDPSADTEAPQTWITTGALQRSPTTAAGTPMRFRGEDRWRHTEPGGLLFSHRLDDREWSRFSGAQEVMLGGLTPGEHTFEVRAMDRNRNIDMTPAALSFRWTNPWYRDVRTVTAAVIGSGLALFFGAVAVNRHRRLQRSYAEVEQIVRERTAELERANRELLLTKKMRALGTLTAGVAHDFNSMLSIIGGSAQIIGQFPHDREKVLKRVERIRSVVDQGANLVKAMLGVQTAGVEQVVSLEVNRIIRQTAATLADRLPPEVHFDLELQDGVPEVSGDPNMMRQLIVNLALNAADAMGEQGVIRLVSQRLEAEPAADLALHPVAAPGYVAVSVVDTGVGIDSEALDRIFEPFYTTKSLSARRGTGLGLSMVYEMASRMGYGIHVRSRRGQGATFTVLIPEGTPSAS